MALTKEEKDRLEEIKNKEASSLTGNDFKEYLKLIANKSDEEIKDMNADGALDRLNEMIQANPRFKNYQRRQELARGIEGGIEALRTLSNISTARRQIDEAKRMENELTSPSSPPITPKSESLRDATEMARRDMTRPIGEIDPLLQRNMDMLRSGFNVADTASGGQAGVNASLKQNAINQARSANAQLIPAIENIRRQQKEEYNRLVAAGISEDDMRFKQAMNKYKYAENRYLTEAEAIGNLRAAGESNLFGEQNVLFDQVGNAVSPAINYNYGGVKASDVNSNAYQTPQFQINPPQLYNQQAAQNFSNGLQGGNIASSGARYVTPKYSAIGNLGNNFQDYANQLDQNLENIYNPYIKR